MYLGDFNSAVAVPITGSDRVTTGYSPSTMHIDPVTGIPFGQELVMPVDAVVLPLPLQPASNGLSPLIMFVVVGAIAWYGYKQGWFTEILQSVGVHE